MTRLGIASGAGKAARSLSRYVKENRTLVVTSVCAIVLVMLLALPLLAFVIWAFYRYVTEPLARLIDAARHVKRGERGYAITP